MAGNLVFALIITFLAVVTLNSLLQTMLFYIISLARRLSLVYIRTDVQILISAMQNHVRFNYIVGRSL